MPTRRVVLALLPVALVGVACAGRSAVPPASAVPSTLGSAPQSSTVVPASTPPATGDDGRREVAIDVDGRLTTAEGRERTYHLYVPAGVGDTPAPLLVALHGGTGSGQQFRRNSGFDALADLHGFIVVYPDGIGVGDNERLRTWNGGYCCGPAADQAVDDVAFVELLLDAIATEYSVDPTRVFAAGHSNGGILSYRLACELADRIVAVGLQAGSLGVDRCKPSQPVSLLHLHGTADQNHPIDGGQGPNSIAGIEFRSARESVRQFAAANGCPSEPTVAVDDDNDDLAVSTWTSCAGESEVRFVAVDGAGHAWMGHESVAREVVGAAYEDLDASAVIIDFLLSHPRL